MTSPSSNPSPPDFVVPDAVGEVYVARAWRAPSHRELQSIATPTAWHVGQVLEAVCDPIGQSIRQMARAEVVTGDHASPAEGCGCGIYGVFDPDYLTQQLGYGWTSVVWGIVAVWGRVIVYDHGVRAEFARPVALFHQPPPSAESWTAYATHRIEAPQIQRIADRYGLDLIDRWAGLTRPEDL